MSEYTYKGYGFQTRKQKNPQKFGQKEEVPTAVVERTRK